MLMFVPFSLSLINEQYKHMHVFQTQNLITRGLNTQTHFQLFFYSYTYKYEVPFIVSQSLGLPCMIKWLLYCCLALVMASCVHSILQISLARTVVRVCWFSAKFAV